MVRPERISALWLAVVLVAGLAAIAFWWWPAPAPAPVNQHVIATPAPEVRTIERVVVQPKLVYVYPDRAKQALDLPDAVQNDTQARVVAATRVTADEHPHTVTTLLDAETGKFTTLDRREPLPWMAAGSGGALGIGYGFKNGDPATRIDARQNLLRIKGARVDLAGTADQDGDWFAGLNFSLTW